MKPRRALLNNFFFVPTGSWGNICRQHWCLKGSYINDTLLEKNCVPHKIFDKLVRLLFIDWFCNPLFLKLRVGTLESLLP